MNSDFSELLNLLRVHKVRYLIVGGYAVMKYTEPRFTKDLDLWIENSPGNAQRLHRALTVFGAPVSGYSPQDFIRSGMVHQIGVPPLRVDLLTSLPGLSFRDAWQRRVVSRVGGDRLLFLSLRDLIWSKRKAGRLQDRLDLQNLEKVRERKRNLKRR